MPPDSPSPEELADTYDVPTLALALAEAVRRETAKITSSWPITSSPFQPGVRVMYRSPNHILTFKGTITLTGKFGIHGVLGDDNNFYDAHENYLTVIPS
jgi:hypothetical protein